jgi:DNA polymerase-3 subunit alpha
MDQLRFDCGCNFPVLDKTNQRIKLDIDKIPFTCKRTWHMLGKGLTKGVFQLESGLGKSWCKKLKPESMEHLAALGAILRPGVLRSVDENNVSMTEHYCRRKNLEEPVEYYHPSLESIVGTTYGIQCYQEQSMAIAQKLAGFNLQQADELRKAIGKKLPEEMKKVEIKFLAGAIQTGILKEEEARQIMEWIKESQKYSFNKSHAVSYAINGYYTAYCKAHFPLQFFTSWLSYAHYDAEPKQERKELIDEARLMDIQVLPPDICNLQAHFHTDGKVITFGLSDIKGVGQANVKKIVDIVKQESKDIKQWTWLEVLSKFAPNGQVSILHKLACAGALRHYGNVRKQLINDIEAWENITKGQRLFIIQNITKFSNLLEALKNASLLKKEGGGTHSEACQRKMEDAPVWIADTEEILLGTSITCSRVDACDMSAINSTCRDFINDSANVKGAYILGVEIQDVNPTKTKKGNNPGQKMARIVMSDGTCALDAVVFPEQYKLYEDLLVKGNTVIVSGERDRRQGGFIVKKMYQANLLGTGEE